MTIYSETCTFPGTAPINATLGWDVVYAVTYDTINADLAARKPWMIDFSGSALGRFDQTDGSTNSLLDAQISQIRFVTGGVGQSVQMALEIASADLVFGGTTTGVTTVVATVQCNLAFVANPSMPGLHNLSVNTSNLNVTGVTSATPLSPAQTIMLQSLIQLFVSANPTIFSGIYANVFTKDYAESVNIPWLLPSAFDYAVSNKINPSSPTDGILAVLGSISGNLTNLSPQVEPLMFPTNTGVNAAVAISTQVVEEGTFLTQFNSQISGALADFGFNAKTNSLFNQTAISAFYRVDSTTQQVSLIPASALADGSGNTYPFTIPVGGLEFGLSPNSITANINNGVVDLGSGFSLTLQMSTSYQLIVDANQNIDLALVGEPVIKSSMSSSVETSAGDIALEFGATALSIVGGEFIAFAVDKLTGFATSTAMSNATVVDLTTRFFAAERQLAYNPEKPVTFSIKGWRTVTMGTTVTDMDLNPSSLDPVYIESVTLRKGYFFEPEDMAKRSGEMSSFSNGIAKLIFKEIAGNAKLIGDFKAALVKNNYMPAENWYADGSNIDFPYTKYYFLLKSLYQGCIEFVIDKVNSGQLSYTIYNKIIANYPRSAVNGSENLLNRGDSIFASNTRGSLVIKTSAGDSTNAVGGLLGDIAGAAASKRAGLAAALFKDIILNTERPLLVKIAGGILYLGGLTAGYFFGQWASTFGTGQSGAEKAATKILNGGPSGPASLLFANVTFPFMTRFSSGTAQGPVPANVLQCAGVNGGLVLGVAITLNQQ